jgi:holo-[acyl-carrier protein] synthase
LTKRWTINRLSARIPTSEGAALILGIGIDVFRTRRIAERLARPDDEVLAAVFTPAELARCRARPQPAGALAACFAAKEAVVKALGGAHGQGMYWQDIEIGTSAGGSPDVRLAGRAAAAAAGLGVTRIWLTVAGTGTHAVAGAVLEGGAVEQDPNPDRGWARDV